MQARLNASYRATDYCCSDPDCCMPSKNNVVGQLATREFNSNPRMVKQYRPPSIQLLRQEQLTLSPGQRPPSIRASSSPRPPSVGTSSPRPLSQRTPPFVRPLSLSQRTSSPRPLSQRTTGLRPLPNNTNPYGPGGSNQSAISADKVALWESINKKHSGIVFDQPGSTPSPGGTTLKRSQSMSSSMQKTILENQRIANERLLESERFRISLLQTDPPFPIQPPPNVDSAQLDQRLRSRSSPGYLSSPTSTVNRLSTPSPPRPTPPPPLPFPLPPPLPPPIAAPSTPPLPLSLRPDSISVPSLSLPASKPGSPVNKPDSPGNKGSPVDKPLGSPKPKYGKNPPWAENRVKEAVKLPAEEAEFNPPPPPKEAEYGWTEQDDSLPSPPQPSLELENIYQALQSFHYASDVDLTRIDPESLRNLFILRDTGVLTTAQFVAAMERLRVSCLSPPGSPTKTIK